MAKAEWRRPIAARVCIHIARRGLPNRISRDLAPFLSHAVSRRESLRCTLFQTIRLEALKKENRATIAKMPSSFWLVRACHRVLIVRPTRDDDAVYTHGASLISPGVEAFSSTVSSFFVSIFLDRFTPFHCRVVPALLFLSLSFLSP